MISDKSTVSKLMKVNGENMDANIKNVPPIMQV